MKLLFIGWMLINAVVGCWHCIAITMDAPPHRSRTWRIGWSCALCLAAIASAFFAGFLLGAPDAGESLGLKP